MLLQQQSTQHQQTTKLESFYVAAKASFSELSAGCPRSEARPRDLPYSVARGLERLILELEETYCTMVQSPVMDSVKAVAPHYTQVAADTSKVLVQRMMSASIELMPVTLVHALPGLGSY